MHSKKVKFINVITSHDARENDATQTSISQPKLDKFQLQCYSKCSKWRPKFDHLSDTKALSGNAAHIYTVAAHAC